MEGFECSHRFCLYQISLGHFLELLSQMLPNSGTYDGLSNPNFSYGLFLWGAWTNNQFLRTCRLQKKAILTIEQINVRESCRSELKSCNCSLCLFSMFLRRFNSIMCKCALSAWWWWGRGGGVACHIRVWDTRQRQLPNWETQNRSLWAFAFTDGCSFYQQIIQFNKKIYQRPMHWNSP